MNRVAPIPLSDFSLVCFNFATLLLLLGVLRTATANHMFVYVWVKLYYGNNKYLLS